MHAGMQEANGKHQQQAHQYHMMSPTSQQMAGWATDTAALLHRHVPSHFTMGASPNRQPVITVPLSFPGHMQPQAMMMNSPAMPPGRTSHAHLPGSLPRSASADDITVCDAAPPAQAMSPGWGSASAHSMMSDASAADTHTGMGEGIPMFPSGCRKRRVSRMSAHSPSAPHRWQRHHSAAIGDLPCLSSTGALAGAR